MNANTGVLEGWCRTMQYKNASDSSCRRCNGSGTVTEYALHNGATRSFKVSCPCVVIDCTGGRK